MRGIIFTMFMLGTAGIAAAGVQSDEQEAANIAQSYFSMVFNGVRLTPRHPQRLVFQGLLGKEYPAEYGCTNCIWVADTFAVRSIERLEDSSYSVIVEYHKCIKVLEDLKVRERHSGLQDTIEVSDGKVVHAPRNDIVGWRAFIRNYSRPGVSVSQIVKAGKVVDKEFPQSRGKR